MIGSLNTVVNGIKLWVENLLKTKLIPTDWNQNDPSAPDYIKNRPFYEATETVTYLEPYTFNASSNAGWVQLPFSDVDKVVVGTVLTVLWDGKTYECVASSNEGISREFGNAKLRFSNGKDTGEPFHITINSPTYYVCVAETGEHTVSVVGYETVPKKIDPKYIPALGGMIVKLTFDSDGTTLLADKTYAEVKAAIDAGAVVRMLDTDGMTYLDLDFASGAMVRFSHFDMSRGTADILWLKHRIINMYSYTTKITDESKEYEIYTNS